MKNSIPICDQVFVLRCWREDQKGESRHRIKLSIVKRKQDFVFDDLKKAFNLINQLLNGEKNIGKD